jgi:hypothetical protein
LGAGDGQLHGPQRIPDVAFQGLGRPTGEALPAPGLSDLAIWRVWGSDMRRSAASPYERIRRRSRTWVLRVRMFAITA